jgi:hypothetical protein
VGTYKVYFESLGIPAAGLAPGFATLKQVGDGADVTPPSIAEVGGGWYKFTVAPPEDYVAVVDGGSSLDEADRYASGVLTPDDFAATEARLAELDAGNVPADADTLLGRLTAGRAAALDNLDAAVSSRSTPGDIASAFGEGVLQSQVAVLDRDPVTIVRGDAATLTFELGAAWDLTGKVAYLCVKADPGADNDTAIVDRTLTVIDAEAGGCGITLTEQETATVGKYYAEVEVADADGTSNPRTAIQFPLLIVQDVRR